MARGGKAPPVLNRKVVQSQNDQPEAAGLAVSLQNAWDALRLKIKYAFDEEEGELAPIIALLGSGQLHAMLLAWIPVRYGGVINTGIYAVDMFVTTLLVTVLVSFLTFLGNAVKAFFLEDASKSNSGTVVSVKVEYYRLDKYGELIVNLHYESLAWLISERSRAEQTGDFRMVPYDPETSNTGSSGGNRYDDYNYWSDDDDDDLDQSGVPDFNILPRGDAPLHIDHLGCKFTVWFEQPTDDGSNNNNNAEANKTSSSSFVERKAKAEPPIIIHRALDVEEKEQKTKPTDQPRPPPSLEWMQNALGGITKLYLEHQKKLRKRARYERSRSGGWYRSSEIHACRGLSSVALDKTQETLLKHDLESFVKDKPFYERMGLPYRRGYLFSGKPGTGKTSLINAISATYNRDLYYINLQQVSDDAALQSAFNTVPKNAVIVFEDVDAQSAVVHSRERRGVLRRLLKSAEEKKEAKRREEKRKRKERERLRKAEKADDDDDDSDEEERAEPVWSPQDMEDTMSMTSVFGLEGPDTFGGLNVKKMMAFGDEAGGMGGCTLSTLLNCLDGHTLSEGTIVVMTTNHPEVLDAALIRPGRIDLHLPLGYCTHHQLTSMYRSVMDDPIAEVDWTGVPDHVVAPCDAMRIMVLYRHTPEIIVEKIVERAVEILNEGTGGITAEDEMKREIEGMKREVEGMKREREEEREIAAGVVGVVPVGSVVDNVELARAEVIVSELNVAAGEGDTAGAAGAAAEGETEEDLDADAASEETKRL